MKPDFWLDRHGDDRYVLTPWSALGTMAFPGLASVGIHLGPSLHLNKAECDFIVDVLTADHYRIKQVDRRIKSQPTPADSAIKVSDTRPKPSQNTCFARPSRIFPWGRGEHTVLDERTKAIVESLRNHQSNQKMRTFRLNAYSQMLSPLTND